MVLCTRGDGVRLSLGLRCEAGVLRLCTGSRRLKLEKCVCASFFCRLLVSYNPLAHYLHLPHARRGVVEQFHYAHAIDFDHRSPTTTIKTDVRPQCSDKTDHHPKFFTMMTRSRDFGLTRPLAEAVLEVVDSDPNPDGAALEYIVVAKLPRALAEVRALA